jgi:hypothetical protein
VGQCSFVTWIYIGIAQSTEMAFVGFTLLINVSSLAHIISEGLL